PRMVTRSKGVGAMKKISAYRGPDSAPAPTPSLPRSGGEGRGATVLKSNRKLFFFFRMVFKRCVHLDQEPAHDRRECDLGGFARLAEPAVKRTQCGVLAAGQRDGAHVKGASYHGPSASDVPLSLPRPALPGPRSQARQRGGAPAVELTQFGQVSQHADGGEDAHAIQGTKLVHLLAAVGSLRQHAGQFLFHARDLLLQVTDEFGLLSQGKAQRRLLGILPGPHELFLELVAPLHQGAQLSQRCV